MSDHEIYEIPHDEEPKEDPIAEAPAVQEISADTGATALPAVDVNMPSGRWVFPCYTGEVRTPLSGNSDPPVLSSEEDDHKYTICDTARTYDYDNQRPLARLETRSLLVRECQKWFTFHNAEIDPSSEITSGTLHMEFDWDGVVVQGNEFWSGPLGAGCLHGQILHPHAGRALITASQTEGRWGVNLGASVSSGTIRSLVVTQQITDSRSLMGVPLIAQDGRSIGCQVWDVIVWSLYQGEDLPSLEYDVFGTDSQTDHWILGVRPGNIYEIERSGSHIYSSRETATQEGLIHFTAPPGPCKIRLREATTA